VDVTFSIAGLSESLSGLLEDRDFVGAEDLLSGALGSCRASSAGERSALEAFINFQYVRLYREWYNLSSAVNHLNLAAEIATATSRDSLFLLQVIEELKLARKRQGAQRP
jgi:hypothetical protein